jgi:hypothetical protein
LNVSTPAHRTSWVSPIPVGAIWRGIMVLRQAEPRTGYAVARGALVVPLTPGRHTIAARCGDEWSSDVAFYWER